MAGVTNTASDTSIVVDFEFGTPFTNGNADLTLSFKSAADHVTHFASFSGSFSKALSAAAGDATCSYGGGCELLIDSSGLRTAVEGGYATVNVCGSPCEVLDSSDADQVFCEVPSQTEVAAQKMYGMTEAGAITGENFGNSASQVANAFDGDNQSFYDSNASECWVGTDFGANKKAVLSSATFYMNSFDQDRYDGLLTLEGCTDTTFLSCNAIHTFDSVHGGFNYLNYEQGNEESYRVFRFHNTVSSGCDIGEINWTGAIALDEALLGVCDVSVAYEG